jgi:trimethylamine--corrinoid protein Co-methyltransferase
MIARVARRTRAIRQMGWKQLTNRYPKAHIVSDEDIEALHRAALAILETTGIKCWLPEGRELLRKAGALVDEASGRVRLGRDIIESALATAPAAFTLTPRNAARAVRVGGDDFATTGVLGPPNCSDLERGRRSGMLADFAELTKLTQFFNAVQMNGFPVEPLDVEVRFRHLEAARAQLTLTDKVPYVFCQSPQRIRDVLAMSAMARGETLEEFAGRPGAYSIINTNTPLQYDVAMTAGVIEMARLGQPILLTPFIIAGASTPATIASAMAMLNAEFLFGLALSQLVRPGAPVVYGCAAKNVDMKTGAPAYGLAEAARCKAIAGQMARRYRVPLRTSNFCSSNAVDMAAGYEAQSSIWSSVTSGCNVLMHAAGWLEGGLCASYEKFVLDVELIQMIARYLEPVVIDDDTLALDEIAEVGPGGHFFGTPRTVATFETAFYEPMISTTQNYGAWMDGGGLDAAHRALKVWKQALNDYQPPPLDAAITEALDAFVAKRKEEGGSPLD